MERVERKPEMFSPRRGLPVCVCVMRTGQPQLEEQESISEEQGEDFIYSLKICAHLQEHLWEPALICSKTPSSIFVTPDVSSCETMVNGCWWKKMFLVECVNEITSMHY